MHRGSLCALRAGQVTGAGAGFNVRVPAPQLTSAPPRHTPAGTIGAAAVHAPLLIRALALVSAGARDAPGRRRGSRGRLPLRRAPL